MNNISSFCRALLPRRCWLCLISALCAIVMALGVFSGASTAHAAVTLQSGQAIHLASRFPSAGWNLALPQNATTSVNALTNGTVIFSNRNVQISGFLDSFSPHDCVWVEFEVGVGIGGRIVSSGRRPMMTPQMPGGCVSNVPFTFGLTLPANARGGASGFTVTLHDPHIHQSVSAACGPNGICSTFPLLV